MSLTKKLAAELIGTFWLVLGGCGSAVISAAFPEVGIGLVGVSLAFGLTVLTMAYAIGHVSGCHLNPAVSVGLFAGGRFPAKDLGPYVVAQLLGDRRPHRLRPRSVPDVGPAAHWCAPVPMGMRLHPLGPAVVRSMARMARLDPSTIVASWTRRVVDVARREGVQVAPFLARARVDPTVLDDPTARVPFATHEQLVRTLAEHLDDPGLGISVGESSGSADFGVVSLLAESSPTLHEALRYVRRFNVLANEASRMDFWVEGRNVVIMDGHFRDGAPVPAPLAEATLAFYATAIRAVTGIREPICEVWLAHPSHRGWTRPRREHFSASLRFERPLNAIVVPAELLDATLLSARPELGAHLRALADRLERDLGDVEDLSVRVAAHVRRGLAQGPASLARTARALGTSARSLQRKLEEEGLSYVAIVDEVRRREVEALLGDPAWTLSGIAERAGYADARALRRACRRWFGESASARRRDGGAR